MRALSKHTIQVTILNDSRREGCDVECGTDWSSPKATTLASQRIKNRFGGKIGLDYLDLAEVEANHEAQKWNEVIKDRNLLLPLLLVNGQLRISGQFDIRQLLDIIEAEVELRNY